MNGHYQEAIAVYKKELELDPAFLDFQAASKLALTYLYEGDYSSAQETAQSAYERSKPDSGARGASISGDIDVGLGKLDQAEARYEESARLYEKQDPTLAFRLLLKAAQVNFEQRQPQALLALGHGHASPWAAGVRGLAYLIMKKNTAAEMEFAALRASVAPLVGEYRAGKIVELYRLEAAAYDGRWQEVMAIEPRLDGIPRNLYALEVGRAYLEAGPLSDAERQLRFALWAQRAWYNEEWLVSSSFLSFTLSEFYLGKVLEQTGRKDEAIKEYLQFLSHFENSPARLPQIAECRAALKRLK